ncbi:myelin protein zero-like 1 like isoform 1-T1 [Synchiropus picturatus]
MELKRLNFITRRILFVEFSLFLLSVSKPSLAIEIYADPEVVVVNGTAAVLKCTFRSSVAVTANSPVLTWTFESRQPDSEFYRNPKVIFYFFNANQYLGENEFKDRVQFVGDINKRDASIQIFPIQFSDNGTFLCDVKNPPDVTGTTARIELRVVPKESLPSTNPTIIIGGVLGGLVLLVLIAAGACMAMKYRQSRYDYEGCTSLDSVNSQVAQPRKKLESSLESSRATSPSGPLQGPVIYAQLDHSGVKSSNPLQKMEPVVYADIRKN